MSDSHREKEIVERALDCADPDDRDALVREACGGDAVLLERIRALIRAGEAEGGFLSGSPTGVAGIPADPFGAIPGAVIDRYKLLEAIGEGGFGIVFMAEQTEPIRRRVALKVIKPGMDSRQVIGRFEAERQALALMDHPNIAQVFDAGTTEAGRPYFVMELVRGIPITTFCRERQLEVEARLRLFMEVCSAVQHAHQKGVIHRDLKPSNILVTLHGERPVPKVIDFGIAKAIEHPLTDKTVFTQFQQFLGTPAYMSPEQMALSGLDVDTRSDIYSLGVLLYELLTGTPPFDTRELLSAGLETLRRTILEKLPERPSTRLRRTSRLGPLVGSPIRPVTLARELDLIVLKALEKDRDRRYATANGLSADLLRYLNHEPVTAVAPTLAYQFATFYRRRRGLVLTASGFALLLVTASLVSAGLALRARRAEAVARSEAATAQSVTEFFWKAVFKQLAPWEHTNRAVSLRDAFELGERQVETRTKLQPLAEASIRLVYGRTYFGIGELARAETNLLRALELRRAHIRPSDERVAEVLYELGTLREFQKRLAEAEAHFEEVLSIRARVFGPDHRDTLTTAARVALRRAARLPLAEAEILLRETAEKMRRFVGADSQITRATLNHLGMLYVQQGHLDRAFELFEETRRLAIGESGEAGSGALWSLELMAATRARQGRLAEADQSYLDLIAVRNRINGTTNLFTLGTRLAHAREVLVPQGRFAEAAPVLLHLATVVPEDQPAFKKRVAQAMQDLLKAWKADGAAAGFEEFQRQVEALPVSKAPGTTNGPPLGLE